MVMKRIDGEEDVIHLEKTTHRQKEPSSYPALQA